MVAKLILDRKVEGTIEKTDAELHVFVNAEPERMTAFIRDSDVFSHPDEPLVRRRSIGRFERDMAWAIPKE